MPNLIKTVDISSHNVVTLGTVNNWIGQGAQALIIRAYQTAELPGLQDVTRRMMAVAEQADIWRLNYAWLYRTVPPERTVADAVALIRSCGGNPGMLMLDCETYTDGRGNVLDPGPTAAQILAAAAECRRQGFNPIIYTAGWWLASPWFEGDARHLGDLPLWYANYSSGPILDAWAGDRFGAWDRPLGHQYTADPVDWSVFDYDWLAELAVGVALPSVGVPAGVAVGLRVAAAPEEARLAPRDRSGSAAELARRVDRLQSELAEVAGRLAELEVQLSRSDMEVAHAR